MQAAPTRPGRRVAFDLDDRATDDHDDAHREHHHASAHHRRGSDAHRTGRQPVAADRGRTARTPRDPRDGRLTDGRDRLHPSRRACRPRVRRRRLRRAHQHVRAPRPDERVLGSRLPGAATRDPPRRRHGAVRVGSGVRGCVRTGHPRVRITGVLRGLARCRGRPRPRRIRPRLKVLWAISSPPPPDVTGEAPIEDWSSKSMRVLVGTALTMYERRYPTDFGVTVADWWQALSDPTASGRTRCGTTTPSTPCSWATECTSQRTDRRAPPPGPWPRWRGSTSADPAASSISSAPVAEGVCDRFVVGRCCTRTIASSYAAGPSEAWIASSASRVSWPASTPARDCSTRRTSQSRNACVFQGDRSDFVVVMSGRVECSSHPEGGEAVGGSWPGHVGRCACGVRPWLGRSAVALRR